MKSEKKSKQSKDSKKEISKPSHKHQSKQKYKSTSQITVDYFPRGGSTLISDKKSKKSKVAEDPEFLFNKAPVTLIKKKRKAPYEISVPDLPKKKRKKVTEEEYEETPLLESIAATKESLDITRIRRLVTTFNK